MVNFLATSFTRMMVAVTCRYSSWAKLPWARLK
jgi:hypothetical protein